MTKRQAEWRAFRRDPFVIWVKSLPCSVPGSVHMGPIDPNHHPTVGSRGKVHRRIFPLCRFHHTQLGVWGVVSFQHRHRLDFEAIMDRLEQEFQGSHAATW